MEEEAEAPKKQRPLPEPIDLKDYSQADRDFLQGFVKRDITGEYSEEVPDKPLDNVLWLIQKPRVPNGGPFLPTQPYPIIFGVKIDNTYFWLWQWLPKPKPRPKTRLLDFLLG